MKTFLPIIFTIFIVISCNSNRIYDENYTLPKNNWKQNNVLVFSPEITDTTSVFDIFIHFRNTGEYPMSNLFLFVKTVSPQGFSIQDTIECVLTNTKGEWLGKGFGNIWSNKILYRKNIRFPYTGKYTFEIEQAMRYEKLPGIVNVGLSIEKLSY